MRYIRLEWGNFQIFHVPTEKVSSFAGYLRHMVCRKQVQSSHPFWPFAGNFNWLVSHVRRPGFSLNFWDDTDIVLSAFHKLRNGSMVISAAPHGWDTRLYFVNFRAIDRMQVPPSGPQQMGRYPQISRLCLITSLDFFVAAWGQRLLRDTPLIK